MSTKMKCDKCGISEIVPAYNSVPEGWAKVSLNVKRYRTHARDLCQACCNKIGLDKTTEQTPTMDDRLFEIVEEMVSDALSNQ